MQRKQNKFMKKFDNVMFCKRLLCEQQPLAALDANDIHHNHSDTDMVISLLHLTFFYQGEDNSIERGVNHYKSGHV